MALLAQVSTQSLITKSISTLTLNVSSITGVVLGAVSPADITSSIVGLASIGYISTSQLTSTVASLASGSGSGFTGSTTFLSSATIFTSTLSSAQLFAGIGNFTSTLTSSLIVSGSEVVRFNGTTSPSFYGHGIDTLTLQTSCNAYQSGVASMAFGVSNTGYPLARIYAIDSALAGSAIGQLVFQTTPFGAGTITSNYTYTGTNQSFVVPAGVTSIQVLMWGAGGSGGAGQVGGAGAFVQGILPVTPGQTYTIVVGQGGVFNSLTTTYGGGGAGGNNINFSGSGGGRSAIQQTLTATISSASGSGSAITYTTSSTHGLQTGQPVIITGLSPSGFNGTFVVASIPASNQFTVVSTQSGSSTGTGTIVAEIVNIGGGGAGPQANQGTGGMATFSGTANSGNVNFGGGGGSQTAGGAAGGGTSSPFPTAGQILLGGTGGGAGGAGGGGYYGGGGGGWTGGVGNGGGGGGSSYISNTLFGFQAGSNSPNSANQAPATTATGYISGVAVGGNTLGNGGNGLIVINSYFGGGTITEAMRIGSNGFVGVATSSPTYALDVAAIGRISNAYIGTNSNLNALQFYGLSGNFNNTVLAEISTGGGSQELLVFKGSSTSDRVRVQTTGNFVIETGVSSRLWSTNTSRTTSNATPAFIINTSSNVGIQTASPGATLDVAGTGRFLVTSTLTMNASTVNGAPPVVGAATDAAIVLATGAVNKSFFSYDGTLWIPGTGLGPECHGIAFNGFQWIAGTEAGIYRSADGITWTSTNIANATSMAAWNGSVWAIGGYYGNFFYSYDGATWFQSPTPFGNVIWQVAWGGDKFVAVGYQSVWYSYDGITWTNLGNVINAGDHIYCVAYNGSYFVIGGRYGSSQFARSFNGINWQVVSAGADPRDLAWNGSIWVAATSANQTMLTSTDGITWTSRTNTNYTDLGVGSVTWNGTHFYASAGNSRAYLSRSSDGINWFNLGTVAGATSQTRMLRARIPLPLNGVQQPAGIYAQNIFLGLSTNATSLRFPGPDALYRNTVIGEISSFNTRFAQDLVLFKGSTQQDSIRLQTTGEIRFEAGVPSRFFSSISSIAPIATPAFLISTNSNVGIGTALPAATFDVVGTGRFQTLSTLALNISSINGTVYSPGGGGGGGITTENLQSTVGGLGQIYLSTATGGSSGPIPFISAFTVSTGSINTSSFFAMTANITSSATISSMTTNAVTIGTTAGWLLTSPIQNVALSTNTIYADQGYINTGVLTTGIVSTMTTNALTLGSGGTWILTSPIQTTVVSSIYSFANQPYFDTVNVGAVSTMNSLEFYGLFGNYNNTVLAEISTGGGTQELLVFKGSSASDRVRVQTTGAFVVETGVSARLFNSNTTQTLCNATPAFIVNSSSNVGIQTGNPAATLDVAGSGRFLTLSSLQVFTSSIVAPYTFQPQYFTF